MEKRRVRKRIVKKSIKVIWIIIFILLMLIIGAFLFSEKVHKIDMIDNIKNRLSKEVEKKLDSNDKIIDIDINENDDLQKESTNRKLTLSAEINQENLISTYSDDSSETQSKPDKPTVNELPTTNQNGYVYVKCITYPDSVPKQNSTRIHSGYISLSNSTSGWNFGEVYENDGRFGDDASKIDYPWFCDLTLDKNWYVELWNNKYSKDEGVHCEADNYEVILTFVSDGKEWYFFTEDVPLVVWITHDISDTVTYKVKYTDGVGGRAFQDILYEGLVEGDVTPLFGDEPIRDGYNFYGWTPLVKQYVSSKDVNGEDNTIVYTAIWEENKVKRDVFFTLKKVFKGLYEIPSDFSLKCNISFENESYSSILNLSNAVEIDKEMSTVYWRIPLYDPLYTDSRNYQIVKIEEFCDVEGYTYEMKSSSGSINGNIITIKFSPFFHSGTRTITNTYYRDNYEEKEEYKIEYYYDNLKDSSKTETLETITEEIINSKKESGQKENYTYEKTVKEGNVVKIYYVSTGSEEPTKPSKLYTITVKNEKAGHTYNSYQVFAGEFAYDKENQPILSNIVWSEEFQKIAENEKTYGDKLIEKLKDPNENTYASLFTDCQTALDIAEILAGKEDDGSEIREFTKVTGKFILENNIKITKGVSEQTTETIAGEEVKSYKITELEAEYYIVIDAKANIEDDAYSRYLIDVVQDVTMEPKSSIPTLSKKVTTNNIEGSEKVNTALHIENGEYDIGFEIVTTIGTDMDAYGSEYKYEVVDILDKGFEYDRESVKIYVGENNVECGKESYTLSDILITEENYNTYKEYFEEGEPSEQYGKTVVLIDFKDIPGKVSRGELLEGQKITINYNAKLNKNCEVGKVANVNKAYLKYSNNPYQIDNTAKTKTVTTLTYTISLNIEKIGEIKTEETEKQYLSGAIFDIYDEPEYKEGILIPEKNQNRKLIGTVEIGEEGKAKYNSLGAGTYYIKESKAPDGYNMLKEEIEMKVIATYDGFDINWEVEDKSNSKLVLIEKEIAEGTNINLEIQNTKGVQLPVTGGMGTLIFTVVGIGIMGLAVIGMKK